MDDMTICITIDGNYLVDGYDLNYLFSRLGITANSSTSWIIKNKEIIFEDAGNLEYVFHII